MSTAVGLRFLRTLATLGEEVPAYVDQAPQQVPTPAAGAHRRAHNAAMDARTQGR